MIGRTDSLRGDSDYLGNPMGASDDLMGRDVIAYYLRSPRWHYVWIPQSGEMALYDLENDPTASVNVVAQHEDLIAQFQTEIRNWRDEFVEYDERF
jgi:hypothetical protein